MAKPKHRIKRFTFYCQVDTHLGQKDHARNGRCVRLIGVSEVDFRRLKNGEIADGVETYVVDVDLHEYLWRFHRGVSYRRREQQQHKALLELESRAEDGSEWVLVEARSAISRRSYFYSTFSDSAPTYFEVLSISPIEGPALDDLGSDGAESMTFLADWECSELHCAMADVDDDTAAKTRFELVAFHVGQGMCSFVRNHYVGVLFDAGAGALITRKQYRKQLSKNPLKSWIRAGDGRRISHVVISHFDHDHWRMLSWDAALRDAVGSILVPSGNSLSVAFFDKTVKSKVLRSSGFRIDFPGSGQVLGYRSQPASSDRNGECLVCELTLLDVKALLPGDYVYERMQVDGNAAIRCLLLGPFGVVIVPHHGDRSSANSIPAPADGAIAFFSAGMHLGYQHPRPESTRAHSMRGYLNVRNESTAQIIEVPLIPSE